MIAPSSVARRDVGRVLGGHPVLRAAAGGRRAPPSAAKASTRARDRARRARAGRRREQRARDGDVAAAARRAAELGEALAIDGDPLAGQLEARDLVEQQAEAAVGGAAQARRAAGADPQRRVRALHRRRLDEHVAVAPEAAVVRPAAGLASRRGGSPRAPPRSAPAPRPSTARSRRTRRRGSRGRRRGRGGRRESTSTVAACSATVIGLCHGSTVTAVPRRSVRRPRRRGARARVSGEDAWPSPVKWCSVRNTLTKPSSSAERRVVGEVVVAVARRRADGRRTGPPNRPKRIAA